VTPTIFGPIQFLGTLFINLLKLFALPLISSALVAALGSLSGGKKTLKSLSSKLVGYMLVSEIAAVTIALSLFNFFKPGVGGNAALILSGPAHEPAAGQQFDFAAFILSLFPDNIFYSLSNFELLPVVVFSILFGLGCSFVGAVSQPIIQLAVGVREVSTKCLHAVMCLAPVGIFALVGGGVAESHLQGHLEESFMALLSFVAVLVIGLLLHGLWQLIAAALISKQKISHILQQSVPVFSTAFGTSSSVATLPVAMMTADALRSKPFVTRFMLPLCASINVGGMMMYEMAAALFFSQMLGIELTLSQQILLAVACIFGGMAEGGIPETSMVSLVVVFKIINIPLSAISFLLPLDRLIDRLRTVVNIFGNMCGVIIISQWIAIEGVAIEEQDPLLTGKQVSLQS
jgi:Na+/H+-dicarboxylate symporter